MSERKTPRYLDANNLDDLARINTALLSELWIMRDRLAVLEQILQEKNILSENEVNDYVPDGSVAERIEALRNTIVANVAGAPLTGQDRSVEKLKKQAGSWQAGGG